MQFLFWIHHSPFTTVHPRSKRRLASLPRLVLISEHLEAKKSWNSLDAPWTGAAMRSLCHLKEISHWSCDGLSWNKSQRKIPKSTTHVKEVTFLAALQSLRVTIGFIKVLCQHRQPVDFVIVDASPNVIMEKEWIIIEAICQPKRILLTNLNIPGGLHICRCERHWRWWEYL